MKTREPADRDFERHYARVMIAEARRRKGQAFALTLLTWAKSARTRSITGARQLELL